MNSEERIKEMSKVSYEKAVRRFHEAKDEKTRYYALGALALACLNVGKHEDARKYANELGGVMSNYRDDWNYGNAIQDVNIVLGRLAIIDGRLDDAKKHLLEAGKTKGSPQMLSFGPNMSLAKDLLEKGEKNIVLEYFDQCRRFWKSDKGLLDKWSNQVANNNIPDFGGNLYY